MPMAGLDSEMASESDDDMNDGVCLGGGTNYQLHKKFTSPNLK